jgi:hypothetical protein
VLLSTVARPNGLLRSDDYGEHWSSFTISSDGDAPTNLNLSSAGINSLVPDPAHPATLYVAMFSGLWKSTDAGASWNFIEQLPLGFFGIFGLVVTDGPTGGVYVETDAPDGSFVLEKSSDGGATWSTASTSFNGEPFNLQGGPGGRLLANSTFFGSCLPPSIQQSVDGGATWSELPDAGVLAQFAVGQCPFVTPTASHVYLSDTGGSRLTFGARYRDLTGHALTGASAPRQLSRATPGSASQRVDAVYSAAMRSRAAAPRVSFQIP